MVVILELCRCTFNLNSSSNPQYWSDQRINVYSKLPTVSFIEFFLMLLFFTAAFVLSELGRSDTKKEQHHL